MIPFGRMNIYGNTAKPTVLDIKRFTCSSSHRALLYTTGELYTAGNGANYKLGTGNTTNSQAWKLVQTDVSEVITGSSTTLIKKKDGTYWFCGSMYPIYGAAANASAWTDCSTLFSTLPSSVQEIKMGTFSTIVRLDSGDLYGIGFNNNYELGMYGAQTSFVKIAEGVSYYSFSSNACWYIKNGVAYRAGSNSSGKLGFASSTGLVTSFTSVDNPTGYTCSAVYEGSDASYLLYTDSSGLTQIYNSGNNAGNLGRGNSTNVYTISVVPNWQGRATGFFNSGSSSALFHYKEAGGIYGAGYNPSGAVGVSSSVNSITTYTATVGLPAIGTIKSVMSMGSSNTFAWCDDGIYWCGAYTYGNGSVNALAFVKLPIPIEIGG